MNPLSISIKRVKLNAGKKRRSRPGGLLDQEGKGLASREQKGSRKLVSEEPLQLLRVDEPLGFPVEAVLRLHVLH